MLGAFELANNTVQLHAGRWLWPEVEMNATDGVNAGRTQVFITPALFIGRFDVWRRMALTTGAGLQIAVTEFHTSNHNVIRLSGCRFSEPVVLTVLTRHTVATPVVAQ